MAGGKQKPEFLTHVEVFKPYNKCNGESQEDWNGGGNVVKILFYFFIVFSDFPIRNIYFDFTIIKTVRVIFNF